MHASSDCIRGIRVVVVALFAGFTAPAVAVDDDKKAKRISSSQARAAIKQFEADFEKDDFAVESLRTIHRVRAVRTLSEFDHRNVVPVLAKHLDEKDKKVFTAIVEALGKMTQNRSLAEKALRKVYDPEEKSPERMALIIEALGNVGGPKTAKEFMKLLSHDDDAIVIGAVRALGNLGDRKILREFREFYEVNSLPIDKGISVRVDTGADTATEAARAKKEADRLNKLRRKSRTETLAACHEALKKLTGKKIETPDQLKEWMRKNRRAWQ